MTSLSVFCVNLGSDCSSISAPSPAIIISVMDMCMRRLFSASQILLACTLTPLSVHPSYVYNWYIGQNELLWYWFRSSTRELPFPAPENFVLKPLFLSSVTTLVWFQIGTNSEPCKWRWRVKLRLRRLMMAHVVFERTIRAILKLHPVSFWKKTGALCGVVVRYLNTSLCGCVCTTVRVLRLKTENIVNGSLWCTD